MELLASNALASLRSTVAIEKKLKHLTELKAEIKHRYCPENAVPPLFDVIRVSLTTPHLVDAAFSILGHLMKRLELQDQSSLLQIQGIKTFPCLLERLADQKDRIRSRALQALIDFHNVATQDVEQFVRDNVLTSRSPKAKEAGMQWVLTIRNEKNIAFRSFVPNIVDCLEDTDGDVRRTAQKTIIDLFRSSGVREMNDLQKQLQLHNVRNTIVDHILLELGLPTPVDFDSALSTHRRIGDPPKQIQTHGGSILSPLPDAPPMSVSEQEAVQLDPVYVDNPRELEEIFREMHSPFEGKESEGNWLQREKSILKLRRMTKGNAPKDFMVVFLIGIKGLLDGILKAVNSLRTTVSTIGCHLIQDLARVAGSGLDSMVEILLQNLIKLCANTKKITAAKGNVTVSAIIAHVTYHVRLTQHIYSACQDKNVQPRSYACGWLKVLIHKHGHHKNILEHVGGLDLIEKCLKSGLADRDKNVRESMRPTYWAFALRWPERSGVIMSGLDKKQQDLLIEDPANPNPEKSLASYATGPSKSTLSHSTSAVQTRPSVKETIMAQKRAAKAAGKNLPERPGSAEPFGSSKKPAMQPISRPATAMSTSSRTISTASVGTLASAPVRPRRRADVPRPATADPYSSRKLMRTDTPPRSPAVSPVKGAKSPATTENSVKMNSKKIESPASTTPAKANSPKKIGPDKFGAQPSSSPTKAAENFTMVIPSIRSPNPYGLISSDSACSMTKFSPNVYEVEEPLLQAQLENGESPVSPPTPRPNGSLPLVNSNGIEKPRRSPVKTASDFGHLSVNGINSQRISMSPRAVAGRKEIMTLKNSYFEEQQPLRVYEDPAGDSNNGSPPPSRLRHTPRALEELPVNEPAKQHRQIFDHQLLAEEPISLDYHQKWLAIEAVERRHINTSESTQNPRLARQILESGIIRIQSRNLDVHGFRKLQTLIRTSGDSMWEDGYKFDELILPLLEYLETPNDEATPRSGKALDLKTQVLVTVRLLLQYQPMYFSTYYPRALTTVLIARKYYNSTSHIVCGLEETAESIVHQCVPEQCIDSVLDLLETERTEGVETNTIFMGLYVQAGLLHRLRDKGLPSPLSGEREERLGKMASRFLSDTNPDIRRAVIEFVLEFHDSMEPEKFWKLVGNAKEDHRSLITYYLARKRNIHQ